MVTGQKGIELIKQSEGVQLVAYPDPRSELFEQCLKSGVSPYNNGYFKLKDYENFSGLPWTIGYGHTGDVKPRQQISLSEAESLLHTDLMRFEKGVDYLVKVDLNQNQFDALVCFAYNVGLGSFKKSTLLKKLNAGDYLGASNEFEKWNKAGGKVLKGLTARRLDEKSLFLS